MKILRILMLVVMLAPNVVLADDDWRSWTLVERMNLSVGYFDANTNTRTTDSQIEGREGRADLDDDPGLDDTQSATVGPLSWRVFKRHMLNFSYYKPEPDAKPVPGEDIVFDGNTVPAGTTSNNIFNLSAYDGSYSIIFVAKKNISLGLGASVQDLGFGVTNPAGPTQDLNEDIAIPLPTIDLGFDYAITEKWIVGIHAGYLDVDVDWGDKEIDGKILRG